MTKTVKARVHYGADSLNLTIPVEIRQKYDINAGDIFEITPVIKNGEVHLIYKRVYEDSNKIG